ncbi:hypothetical protein W911_09745 [Hyphomicrobium nitrativorans NL23]|uniref:Uncharacterized protein n=1 Tax=Hyphomicrobium nitrativorans NL23 TaxID=1029756 RepID=V5SEY3_9HYPH|nr:hypothetical protein [Hyphomicrobium nitrativorans]AHB48610.1 hypothetical protein W911_09745 [Hyphomicrobium nitrativorans NL23]
MERARGFGWGERGFLVWKFALVAGAVLMTLAVGHPPATADEGPRNLVCTFENGASWSYEDGAFKSTTPQPLSFRIGDIDLEEQTAVLRLKPEDEGGKLSVVRAINANHFIEAVTEGFLNLTTVYDVDQKTGQHPAVHSRHFGLIGQPVFGQYTGFCRPE